MPPRCASSSSWTSTRAYTLGITPAATSEAKPKTRRSRKSAAKKTDAVEEGYRRRGRDEEGSGQEGRRSEGSEGHGCQDGCCPKAAKKTNVGKKM